MSKFDPYLHLNIAKNPDGSITRLMEIPTLPASGESAEAGEPVVSKDVTINAEKNVWARIFRPSKLPSNDNAIARLPIFVYFHGGGWILFTAADAMVHMNAAQFATELPAIVVSVDYRLSPESRLPAQYDDATDVLIWVKNQALNPTNGEEWLRDYADFSRVYLYGVSNGGNIVFNVGLRTLDLDLKPLRIAGLIMNQPMFGGVHRTKSEIKYATDQLLPLPAMDVIWELTLPPGTNKDHRYCNPLVGGSHREKISALGRCLVIGYGGDPMIDRQQEFVKMLVMSGVQVEARFDDVGFHGIDIVDPRRAAALMNLVKDFV